MRGNYHRWGSHKKGLRARGSHHGPPYGARGRHKWRQRGRPTNRAPQRGSPVTPAGKKGAQSSGTPLAGTGWQRLGAGTGGNGWQRLGAGTGWQRTGRRRAPATRPPRARHAPATRPRGTRAAPTRAGGSPRRGPSRSDRSDRPCGHPPALISASARARPPCASHRRSPSPTRAVAASHARTRRRASA